MRLPQPSSTHRDRPSTPDGLAVADAFLHLARARLAPAAREWLDRSTGDPRVVRDLEAFTEAFTVAARRVGKAPLDPDERETARLRAAGVTWPVAALGLDEVVRAALLVRAAAALETGAAAALVEETYRRGDSRERQAVLRGLALLPEAERFLDLAVEACRSSIQPLFEAIACENPYPATYFPEPSFNQMVLKALFTGAALRRVVGLAGRLTDELRRMAADYASERRAAGRPVPPDIDWLLAEKGIAS